jgi:dolichyl-phosphate-mannose-protein mannosyltransferase
MQVEERELREESRVSPGTRKPRREPSPAVFLTILIVLASALRFWRLGDWGFDSDEIFMLRDSVELQHGNPRPLLYWLNHYLVQPFVPLNEFGIRVLPAFFGVLAIPALYLVARRLVGTRAALYGALLLAVSGLHVYYSQFGRYWTLVFLLSAVYPFAIYLGLRERSVPTLVLGLFTGVLAVLAHPASVLLLGGMGVWLVATYLRRDHLAWLWSQKDVKSVRWGAGLVLIVMVAVALRFIPMLRAWIVERDTVPRGEFLLHLPDMRGVKELLMLSGYVESLTLPLVLIGAMGIYLLSRRPRDRSLAFLLASMFIFPVAFILLLSFRTPISTFYLVPTTPILFIGAGVFIDRLTEVDLGLRPRWLLPATVVAVIISAGGPTLISQYLDGRRYDFRGAAQWLNDHLAPGDLIFSDQPVVMSHYLRGMEAERLVADPPALMQSERLLHQTGHDGTLWLVAPYTSRGSHRTNRKIGVLKAWIYDHCQLRNVVGVARLDFRVNELQIFQCPPATAATAPTPPT